MRIRGMILNPQPDGTIDFLPDGLLVGNDAGTIESIGPCPADADLPREIGVIVPGMFDNHIHIPQHPIRGQFAANLPPNPPGGRLLAALNQNVFPTEARCADADYTATIVNTFADDTLAHGVIGGAAYMTVHSAAARIALERLPHTWHLGPVLMNQNCPDYLRTDENWREALVDLAGEFGRRVIVTDRFAVAVDSSLRRDAVQLAKRLGLRMQTHLNEQLAEKQFVERTLYPDAGSYTNVYQRDGLLGCDALLAHCIWMNHAEWQLVAAANASVVHCPTSNTLLGSGVMPLDELFPFNIPYAICTDVGASPTTSLLAEMAIFLKTHFGRSTRATPGEALYRTTLAAAKMLHLSDRYGSFAPGKSMTFVEVDLARAIVGEPAAANVIEAIVDFQRPTDAWLSSRDRLADKGLDSSPALAGLEADVEATAAKLDGLVRKTVVDGATAYTREN